MDEEEVQIPDNDKEVLLNQTPSENGGVSDIKLPEQVSPPSARNAAMHVSTITDKNSPDPITDKNGKVDFINKEPDTYVPDPNTTDYDYTLPTEEFKSRYLKTPGKTTVSRGLNEGRYTNFEGAQRGVGVEDYRDYIVNPIKGQRLDYIRALNQSNWAQARNAVGRVVVNFLPEVGQQSANVVENFVNWFRTERGNPFSDLMQEGKDAVNEMMPIYREDPNMALDLDDFAYYAEQGSNLATSVLGFLALGRMAGKVPLATGIARGFNTFKGGKNISNFLRGEIKNNSFANIAKTASMGKRGASYVDIGDAVWSSYLLTSAESVGSATQVYREVYDQVLKESLEKGLSKNAAIKKAKQEAIDAGDFTMLFNQSNIFLNLTSVMPFLKKGKGAFRGPIKKRTYGNSAKRLAIESGQEYAEESVNFLSEQMGTGKLDFSIEGFKEGLTSREGFEAGLLGAIGGFAQTSFTISGQYIPFSKDVNGNRISDYSRYQEEYAQQEELISSYPQLRKEDKANMYDLFYDLEQTHALHEELARLEEELQEGTNPTETQTKIDDLTNKMFVGQVYKAFKYGLGNEFIENLEALKEDFKEKGDNEAVAILEEKIKETNILANHYNTTLNLYRGQDAYRYASEVYYYEELKKKYKNELTEYKKPLDKLIKDIQEASGNESIFSYDENTGQYKFDANEIEKQKVAENEQVVSENIKQLQNIEEKIEKEEKRLKEAKEIPDADNTKQIEIIEKNIAKYKNQQKEVAKTLTDSRKSTKQILSDSKKMERRIERLLKKLEKHPSFQSYNALIKRVKELNNITEEYTEKYDTLTSIKGQQEAKKEYKTRAKTLAKIRLEQEAAARQVAREEREKETTRQILIQGMILI